MEERSTPISIEEVQTAVNRLKALDLKTASYNEVRTHTDVLVNCGFSMAGFPRDKAVYRGRVVEPPHERYNYVHEISYAPIAKKNSIIRYNRLSTNRFQIFYGVPTSQMERFDQLIALLEVGSISEDNNVKEELIQIGGWKMKADIRIAVVGVTGDIPFENVFARELQKFHLKGVSELKQGREQIEMVDQFMSHEFEKKVKKGNEWEYKISAAYGDGVFEVGYRYDIGGILFPSMKAKKRELNIAFHSDVVDSAMEIFASAVTRSTNIGGTQIWIDYTHLSPTIANGEFVWELPGKHRLEDKYISTMKENVKNGLPFTHSIPANVFCS